MIDHHILVVEAAVGNPVQSAFTGNAVSSANRKFGGCRCVLSMQNLFPHDIVRGVPCINLLARLPQCGSSIQRCVVVLKFADNGKTGTMIAAELLPNRKGLC